MGAGSSFIDVHAGVVDGKGEGLINYNWFLRHPDCEYVYKYSDDIPLLLPRDFSKSELIYSHVRAHDLLGTREIFAGERNPSCVDIIPRESNEFAHWLAAVASLIVRPDYLRGLFIAYNRNVGGVVFQLWHDSRAEYVLLDDFVPAEEENEKLTGVFHLYSGDLWLPLLMKAHAKIYGSYLALNDIRSYSQLLRDLTGEIVIAYSVKEMNKSERSDLIQRIYQRKVLGMVLLGSEGHNGDPVSVIEIYRSDEGDFYLYMRHTSKVKGSQYAKAFHDKIPETLQSHIVFPESEYFWVPWSFFHRFFRALYVCHLTLSTLPPRYSPGFFLDVISDSWSVSFAGGDVHCMTWQKNPKYRLSVSKKHPFVLWRVRVTLTLKDYNPNLIVEPIGLTVCADEPLLGTVIAQSNYDMAKDVSLEFPVITERGTVAANTFIIIPSTKNPNVYLSYFLSVSIQCDLFPRGVKEGPIFNELSLTNLHSDLPDVQCVMKSHMKTVDDETIGEDRSYTLRKSKYSFIDIERISGVDAKPYSIEIKGRWSPDTKSGPFRDIGTSGGRIGTINEFSANNPCYKLSLYNGKYCSKSKGYVKVDICIFLSQKVEEGNTPLGICCYILNKRGIFELASEGGKCSNENMLGETAFFTSVNTTRRWSCKMRYDDIKQPDETLMDKRIVFPKLLDDRKKRFCLAEEVVYRDLILMPSTWKTGDCSDYNLTILTNVPVKILELCKLSLKEMKRNLR